MSTGLAQKIIEDAEKTADKEFQVLMSAVDKLVLGYVAEKIPELVIKRNQQGQYAWEFRCIQAEGFGSSVAAIVDFAATQTTTVDTLLGIDEEE